MSFVRKAVVSYYTLIRILLAVASLIVCLSALSANNELPETSIPVRACVFERAELLTNESRTRLADCLGWQPEPVPLSLCRGNYNLYPITSLPAEEIRIKADNVSLVSAGRSALHGHVEVQETQRIINAQTAFIYRDAKTKEITKIELLDNVRYRESDKLMIAKKATIAPNNKAGHIEDLIYRLDAQRTNTPLPAWGRAHWAERFPNEDYLMRNATYTTCAPNDNAWEIEADEIALDHAKGRGVAKKAVLRLGGKRVFYVPYFSFPTTKERKSGFLMPLAGYSNVGGYNLALPYYWNIAPNYDATITPQIYTLRGLMMGGNFRYLTKKSTGIIQANVLPHDQALANFIFQNKARYPSLQNMSTDRWSFLMEDHTSFTNNLQMNINYQQVSDDYYLQDFSTNLAVSTENQLLRQGNLTYNTDHWLFNGLLQSYQTLHPINQSVVASIYERLPQLQARAFYADLPLHARFGMLNEYDNFRWPSNDLWQPQGPRYHTSPAISIPLVKSWGYLTPTAQLVENYYNVHYLGSYTDTSFNRTIPRYSLDGGLTFERTGRSFTQLLQPRLYYLNVPYHDQTPIPVYDSAYMIFTTDQLFRDNRFSGLDRIGDANQLAYAITSRWLSEETGQEKVSLTVGQIRYFENRRVELCYQQQGTCIDNPLTLGYLSPVAKSSPIASRATYQLSRKWVASGDYVWDVYTHATNNGNLNFHYQPSTNRIINFGYTYLVNGNVLQMPLKGVQNKPLHQATIAYAWPINERWSGIGAYSHNVSDNYSMMSLLGMQYDTCCWAMRVMGGRTFKSIEPSTFNPQYNNNIYFQVVLKGLGGVATGDPAGVLNSYLPGYQGLT